MGRRIPIADDQSISIHQTISFSLLLAGMAAMLAISTTLCGVRFRRKSSSSPSSPSHKPDENSTLNIDMERETGIQQKESENALEHQGKELPLPPSKQLKATLSCKNLQACKPASKRNFVRYMSMQMSRSKSVAIKDREGDQSRRKKKGRLKHEDSIWTKTIILGEKCKVPDEDPESVIYDSKGNRILAYHPKTPSPFSISRQNSFNEPTAIP